MPSVSYSFQENVFNVQIAGFTLWFILYSFQQLDKKGDADIPLTSYQALVLEEQ